MWSNKEKDIARRTYERAMDRESKELLGRLKKMASAAETPEDIWEIHGFITSKIEEIDKKYDFRYSALIPVFGRLVREERIGLNDLEGLTEDKIEKIRLIAGLD
jgi:hypothetical protein